MFNKFSYLIFISIIFTSCSSEYKNIDWDNVDIVMVCVQTPSLESNQIDTSFVKKVFMSIENYINENIKVIFVKF